MIKVRKQEMQHSRYIPGPGPDAANPSTVRAASDPVGVISSWIEDSSSHEARVTGAEGSLLSFLLSLVYSSSNRPMMVILPTWKEAVSAAGEISFFMGVEPDSILFPPYNIKPFHGIAYHNEAAASRIRILYSLMTGSGSPHLIVTPAETLLQRVIPKSVLSDFAELIMVNEEIDRERLINKLESGGYSRVTIVEEPGDYAVRGGIIDLFPPDRDNPVRIEMFGDLVESIRSFSVATQRRMDDMTELIVLPAREAVLSADLVDNLIESIQDAGRKYDIPGRALDDFIASVREQGVMAGLESFLSLLYPEKSSILDYMPDDMIRVTIETSSLHKAMEDAINRAARNYLEARKEQKVCMPPQEAYLDPAEVFAGISRGKLLRTMAVDTGKPVADDAASPLSIQINASDVSDIADSLSASRGKGTGLLPLADWLEEYGARRYARILVCRTEFQAKRLADLLDIHSVSTSILSSFPACPGPDDSPLIVTGEIVSGFVWHDRMIAVLFEDEIFGKKRRRRLDSRTKRVRTAFFDLSDLAKGEPVVHDEHGIGIYRGIEKITIEGISADFLVIEYRNGDLLYVPVDRMESVQRYVGVDGVEPVIDKLGGTTWQKAKEKTRKSVERIAGDLLRLYAERKVKKGYAFSPPDEALRDFEAGFPYEETPDQVRAINDVLEDMAKPEPMDRLICGDVGYGKTEIALRAAFRAVYDGKQVAVLVPTTLLAEQHFQTFSERFASYPVQIACLTRFRSRKEQAEIIEQAKSGKIDIVIGTHRLLQKDVEFKDLGLLVIDEEQRFGVRHKERLKKLRSTIDVLSMTATPIPRTLHLSMLGVRDISVIMTPPAMRRPITTYICEFDDRLIAEAINNEIARQGQIFFVHNNIHSIWHMASKLQQLAPDARIGVAHGRLSEKELEEVMLAFIAKDINLLVCTTIIEAGLDIPNANTIIINRADRFGLAQMYQLRGRVGRAGEQAYAYLIIPRESGLSRDARKRLKVIMEYSDLGAGFQIATHDLKIRGAGSILGIAQSGRIAAVGYDMFLKLMEETMARLKGETVVPPLDPEINIPVSVYIPDTYVSDPDMRVSVYRRLSRMTEIREVADFKVELEDRFGSLPEQAVNLLLKIMLRILARKAGIKRLDMNTNYMLVSFSARHVARPEELVNLVAQDSARYSFTEQQGIRIKLDPGSLMAKMNQAKKLLLAIAECVNG